MLGEKTGSRYKEGIPKGKTRKRMNKTGRGGAHLKPELEITSMVS